MAFLLEREPLNGQGGKFTFTAPDGREAEGKVFLDGVSVAPNERTELDLNAIPKFEMPDREKLSASFEVEIMLRAAKLMRELNVRNCSLTELACIRARAMGECPCEEEDGDGVDA